MTTIIIKPESEKSSLLCDFRVDKVVQCLHVQEIALVHRKNHIFLATPTKLSTENKESNQNQH